MKRPEAARNTQCGGDDGLPTSQLGTVFLVDSGSAAQVTVRSIRTAGEPRMVEQGYKLQSARQVVDGSEWYIRATR